MNLLLAPAPRFTVAVLVALASSFVACSAPDAPAVSTMHRPRTTGGDNGSGTGANGGDGPTANGATGGNNGVSGGSNGGSSGGGGGSGGAAFTPAAHPPLPTMVSSGGAVMTAPKVVPIFYQGDDLQAQITQFLAQVGASAYWKANTSEYGVGALTATAPVVLAEAAPTTIDDSGIQQAIAGLIANGRVPAASTNVLYTIYFPLTTTVTAGNDRSCSAFGGYHSEGKTNAGGSFVYAVIPRCANFNGLNGMDMVTVASSHEFIEAATDPLVESAPAYQQPDQDHAIWGILFTSEAGDMCAALPGVDVKPPGLPFTVQRSWSNVAAKAHHHPCAPQLPGEVYFNSAPALDDDVTITLQDPQGQTQRIRSKGVLIPRGQSKTIDVALYSDGPTNGPWTVNAIDASGSMNNTSYLSFKLDKTQGKNGDHLKLTITPSGVDPQLGVAPFVLTSKLGGATSVWVGAVGVQ